MSKLELVKQEKIIAIVRGIARDKSDATGKALVEGGIRILEITMNTDGALETIKSWRSLFSRDVTIG
ncbi:MAG TPA: 2-dehydro-3-deoxyphosphogluconate aldolase, partial [Bacilli bacterium]